MNDNKGLSLDYVQEERKNLDPSMHYHACIAREKGIDSLPARERVRAVVEDLLFSGKLFTLLPVGRLKGFNRRHGGSFNWYLAPTKPLRATRFHWQYQSLVKTLKKENDMELRWLLIARWLKHEGVCEPNDFLPACVLKSLAQRYHKSLELSPETIYLSALIRNWLTYFRRIKVELDGRKEVRRAKEEVVKLHYDKAAVEWVYGTRSLKEAIYGWLGERKNVPASRLRNAYSATHGQPLERKAK